ncbi:phosphonate C-P lyase system protein PhnH [Devosia submarina]|uniref:phosphonate C-P lyase system protein PhnH n=1 Tax=Devosia submarina TaxID=1173082 RepID=UPI000D3D02F3|nr:phosphonate C-P lyase system protein PhnH [Devosia submarina]
MEGVIDGAFADPVMQSQSVFRALMDALANPGTMRKLPVPRAIGTSMIPELVSTLLTLSDHDTSIWLDEVLRSEPANVQFASFHTGAPMVAEPGRAAFAFVHSAEAMPPLDQFNPGTQDYPDRSTTIVLAVPSLSGGPALSLRGPGMKDEVHISPSGLPGDFVGQWEINRALFPRGVDLLLVADGHVMGLPRTTRIAEGQ